MKVRIILRNSLYLLLILKNIYVSTIYSQSDTSMIFWREDRPITWEDFRGNIPYKKGKIAAEIAVGLTYGSNRYKGYTVIFDIYAFMDRQESWTKLKKDSFALKHEQVHFDIAELYARKLRKKLNGKKIRFSRYVKYESSMFKKYQKKMVKYQLLYDKKTERGCNPTEQIKWNERIAKELKLSEKYKNPEVRVILK
ncbi:MAG: hypothetical protein KatS3mg035_2274 [Bacteroidia bacterium]|nr:MAG: hypothetical protein KatS3mg031_3055 [Chitinophagales bacterium]GIV45151.1 MAG: hypothetical protein KatS3mg035_2274 [Bacteroidia bacterium]